MSDTIIITETPAPTIAIDETTLNVVITSPGLQGPPGTGGGGGASGIVEVDFGATPSSEASVSVTGQASILTTSVPHAWISGRTASDSSNTSNDHLQAGAVCRVVCSEPTAATGFTISVYVLIGFATGKFKLDYRWT